MDRRHLIKNITILTGATFVGSEFFLTGCKNEKNITENIFSKSEIDFFDEVAETIIPMTETPGAKDAKVGEFIVRYAKDCYSPHHIETLKNGVKQLNEESNNLFKKKFISLNALEKHSLLTKIDAQTKSEFNKDKPHYFTLIKQMTLLGFFTSELGSTKVLRYEPLPGEYIGIVPYHEGDTSWA